MSVNVIAPVLWDGFGNFMNGAGIAIDSAAIVVGIVPKPTSIADQTPIPTLQVKDNRASNTYYLNWTLAQWQQAVGNTSTAPAVAGGGGSGGSQDLNSVLAEGNVTQGIAIFNDTDDNETSINSTGVTITDASGNTSQSISTKQIYVQGDSGFGLAIDIESLSDNRGVVYPDATGIIQISGAPLVLSAMQTENGGDVTINDGVRGLYYDPPTVVASATITLPLNPVDGQEWEIWFGGTITGNPSSHVITSLALNGNGHSIVGITSITEVLAGFLFQIKYRQDIDSYYSIVII